jgi:hypothetical protein
MNDCYVYALIDPITKEMFYVGKGTGYRDKSHLKPSLWKNPKDTTNPFLYYKIRSLMLSDTPPIIERLYENIHENEAYEIENKLIEQHGRRFVDSGGKLFNISEFMGGNKKGATFAWSEERIKTHQTKCKEKRKYDPTYDELYSEYISENLTRKQIAEKHNVSNALVKKRLHFFGIHKPSHLQYPQKNQHECSECKDAFTTPASVKDRKYCSRVCYERSKKYHYSVL